LWRKLKEIRKRKRNEKREDIFSNPENKNIKTTDSRVKVEYAGKHFRNYRNRPEIEYL